MLWPFACDLPVPETLLAWIMNWMFLARHNYILHNHVHHPFTTSNTANRVLGILLGFATGMTAGNWKITHVHGHHTEHLAGQLRSRPRLEALETTRNGNTRLSHIIIRSLTTMPLQLFWPAWVSFQRGFLQGGGRAVFYRFCFWEMALIWSLTAALFAYDWRKCAVFVTGTQILVITISRYTDHLTHAGADSRDPLGFANICLSPSFNSWFWNFGYHIAHHIEPRLHWSKLRDAQEGLPIEPIGTRASTLLGHVFSHTFRWQMVNARKGPD
jgi:fatty acid desaturase